MGDPGLVGWFLLFSRSGRHKTKETYPTRPGSPSPCKQGLSFALDDMDEIFRSCFRQYFVVFVLE